jgi:nickel-dependent lactate racemase
LDEPGVFIVLSDVKHHYFAGYSNPIKNFVPGLCAFETTEQNHSWTMDGRSVAGVHPWHPDESRRDNPLAADQLEAMRMIVGDRRVWALATISSQKQIQWAAFGDAEKVTPQAFAQADAQNARAVKCADYMIVSPGGLPNDVDLYIAQRALELTASVLRDGGQLLFLAACPNGVGSARTYYQFYRPMTEPVETMKQVKQADYQLFSHKPIRFIQLIGRLKQFAMVSELPSTLIGQMHMQPCQCPQTMVDAWIEENPTAKILIVDGANKLLLTPADS